MGLSCVAGFCQPVVEKKGAQSSGPSVGSQAPKTTRLYPQKVWITLWVEPIPGAKTAAFCANPLAWSNNDHSIKIILINRLRALCAATGLKPDLIPLIEASSMGSCA
jgi:hypothetical protein